MSEITFKKVTTAHKSIIFSWLSEPHVQEFWDNTQGHRDDILNFMEGRKTPSTYGDGKYVYWIASFDGQPYAMLMTIQETHQDDIGELKRSHLSSIGHTYGIDYMIGNTEYLGKGYGARTLRLFLDFFRNDFDKKADTFFIDPATNNPRAKRVYEKAGFQHLTDFIMGGDCSGSGKPHHLLIKKMLPTVTLELSTLNEYQIIQNMVKFYVYDLSKECGHIADKWQLTDEVLLDDFDFKNYFEEESREAYLVKVYEAIAGFVLLNQATVDKSSDWNIGEFFILGRYQRQGIGKQVAEKVCQLHSGKWEVSVIPENQSALKFWENTIHALTGARFTKDTKFIDCNKHPSERIILTFNNKHCKNLKSSRL